MKAACACACACGAACRCGFPAQCGDSACGPKVCRGGVKACGGVCDPAGSCYARDSKAGDCGKRKQPRHPRGLSCNGGSCR